MMLQIYGAKMNIYWVRFLRLILLFLIISYSYASNSNITIIAEDYKPLSYLESNEFKGPNIDVIKLMLKKLHITNEIKHLPWKRAYETTLETLNQGLISTTRTEERENSFKWVGPLSVKKFNIYALKSSNITIKSTDDFKNHSIGVERGTINEQMLLSRGMDDSKLSKVNYAKQNMGMLLKRRIKLWAISSSTFHETLVENKINSDLFEVVYTLNVAKQYIAFNINMPDEIIKLWQKTFDELINSGKIKEIFIKHNVSYLYTE